MKQQANIHAFFSPKGATATATPQSKATAAAGSPAAVPVVTPASGGNESTADLDVSPALKDISYMTAETVANDTNSGMDRGGKSVQTITDTFEAMPQQSKLTSAASAEKTTCYVLDEKNSITNAHDIKKATDTTSRHVATPHCPAVSEGGLPPPPTNDKQILHQKRWVCDVCKVKWFLDFNEACAHEEQCQGAAKAVTAAAAKAIVNNAPKPPTILGCRKGWLNQEVKDYVKNLPRDHPSIDTCRFLQGLTDEDSKIAAFILQNTREEIASWLGKTDNDDRIKSALAHYRGSKEFKKMKECQEGGSLDNYTKDTRIARAEKTYADFVDGQVERSDDNVSMTLLFNGNKLTMAFYCPLHSSNQEYKDALLENARVGQTLSSKSIEYRSLTNNITDSKRKVLEVRRRRAQWFGSFKQEGDTTALTDISIEQLLCDDVSDKDKDAFCGWMASVFEGDQFMDANLQKMYWKSEFWPKLQHQELEERERCLESESRLRILELQREGLLTTHGSILQKVRDKYKEERRKTLLLIAKRVLNPDHDVAKILLTQIKTRVDADEGERKKVNKKKTEKNRIKRSSEPKCFAGDDFTWDELEEAAFDLLKQKIVKRVGNKL